MSEARPVWWVVYYDTPTRRARERECNSLAEAIRVAARLGGTICEVSVTPGTLQTVERQVSP